MTEAVDRTGWHLLWEQGNPVTFSAWWYTPDKRYNCVAAWDEVSALNTARRFQRSALTPLALGAHLGYSATVYVVTAEG